MDFCASNFTPLALVTDPRIFLLFGKLLRAFVTYSQFTSVLFFSCQGFSCLILGSPTSFRSPLAFPSSFLASAILLLSARLSQSACSTRHALIRRLINKVCSARRQPLSSQWLNDSVRFAYIQTLKWRISGMVNITFWKQLMHDVYHSNSLEAQNYQITCHLISINPP